MKFQPFAPRIGPAMTLVETAVVVTLGSGAVALLMPTFKDAREAAKLQTCLSNLGQVNRAFIGYVQDRGAIPLYAEDGIWASWTYGGWSGNNRAYWESESPSWNVQTADRPLSVYMTPWEIPQEVDRFTPTEEKPLFKCPADLLSGQWQWSGQECPPYGLSAYNDVGTSYQANWHWWDQVSGDHPAEDWEVIVGVHGTSLIRKYMEKEPDRFILLLEDPADWGFGAGGIQTQGNHGQFSWHTVRYADGSVNYLYLDTRHEHDSIPNPPGPRHGKFENLGKWSVVDWQNDHTSGGRHL